MVAIAATEQAVFPPRVQISITGLTVGDDIEIYRDIGAESTLLRGGVMVDVADTSFIVVDAEMPFGVSVVYRAVVNGVDTYSTAADTYSAGTAYAVASDAVTGLGVPVIIWRWPDLTYDRRGSLFKPAGRNVLVSGGWGQFESEIELGTETASAREAMDELLRTATGGIILIRQPGGYDIRDAYLAVRSGSESRTNNHGKSERRAWPLNVAQVDGWADELEARGFTLQDIANAYTMAVANTVTNPGFETNTTGWTSAGATSFARSTAQFHSGVASALLTPTGAAGTSEALGNLGAAIAGESYAASVWVRSTVARNVLLLISYYTAGSSLISSTSVTVACAAGVWTELTATGIAPATTTQARVRVQMTGTPPAGNTLYIDDAVLTQTLTLNDLNQDYASLLAVALADWS